MQHRRSGMPDPSPVTKRHQLTTKSDRRISSIVKCAASCGRRADALTARDRMSGQAVSAAGAQWREIMDDTSFDNIARRLGGLRSRRAALKTAGGAAAVVFTALGLETSARAQVSIENHCKVPGLSCNKKKQCCGAKKKSKEIVCDLSNAGTGPRCCG